MNAQTRSAAIAVAALALGLAAPAAFAQQSTTGGDSGSMAAPGTTHHMNKESGMSHAAMSHADEMKAAGMTKSGTSDDGAMSHDGDATGK